MTCHRIPAVMSLALSIACGPAPPGEDTTDLPDTSDATTGPTGDVPTGDAPDTIAATTDASTSEPDPGTTGEPAPTCPEGQPSLSPQWDLDLDTAPAFAGLVTLAPPLTTHDGRIAVGVYSSLDATPRLGVQFLSALGEPLGQITTESPPSVEVDGKDMALRADGSLVLVGARRAQSGDSGWLAVVSADETTVSFTELASTTMNYAALVVHAGATLILGHDRVALSTSIGAFDDAGQPIWERMLSDRVGQNELAVGPGGEIVVGSGAWSNEPADGELRARRLTADGAIVWDTVLTPEDSGVAVLGGMVILPEGQVVLIEQWLDPPRLVASALTLDDGAPAWRSEIAGPTVDGPPQTFGVVPAPGGLQVLVTRSDEANTLPLIAAIHPMSAAGVAGTTRPLAVPALFGPLLVPARGPCGDLLAIHLAEPAWLGSFAP